jgi:hypothetical protein
MEELSLKQDLSIFLKRVLTLTSLRSNKSIIASLEEMAINLEKYPEQLSPLKFFDRYFSIFEAMFNLKDRKIDFFVFEFLEKAFKGGSVVLLPYCYSFDMTYRSKRLSTHDFLLQNLCRLLDYKDGDYSRKIVRFITKTYLLNPLDISNSSLNKVICALFINYFDSAQILNDLPLQVYTNNCLKAIIVNVFSSIEILNDEEIQVLTGQQLNLKSSEPLLSKQRTLSGINSSDLNFSRYSIKRSSKKLNSSMIDTVSFQRSQTYKNVYAVCEVLTTYIVERAFLQIERDDISIPIRHNVEDLSLTLIRMPSNKCTNLFGFTNLTYGWCAVCHKGALLYCRDHALPICSISCKILLKSIFDSIVPAPSTHIQRREKIFDDGQAVLKYLTKVAFINQDASQETNEFKFYVTKLFSLIFKHAGTVFYSNVRTVVKIRDFLIKNLTDNFYSEDIRIFKLTLRILQKLMSRYSRSMKMEFYAILNFVVMRSLKSENCPSEQRIEFLKWVVKILSKKDILVQLYLNYDADIYLNDIVLEFISILIRHFRFAAGEKSTPFETSELPKVWQIVCDGIRILLSNYEILMNAQFTGQNIDTDAFEDINLITKRILTEDGIQVDETYKKRFQNSPQKFSLDFTTNESHIVMADKLNNLQTIREKVCYAIQNFNINSKKGINDIRDLSFMYPSLSEIARIARIFHADKRISKLKMGEFFSNPSDFNQKVLEEFLALESFIELKLDDALRKLFYRFELPSEGQQIDRILNVFALKYHLDNPRMISASCAYGLSFLLMMLQSEWHNPNVVDKMSFEQFIKLAKSVNEVPKYFNDVSLKALYISVSSKPLASYEFHKQDSDLFLMTVQENQNSSGSSVFSFSMNFLFGNAVLTSSKNSYLKQLVESAKKSYSKLEYQEKSLGASNNEEIRIIMAEIFRSCVNSSLVVSLCVLLREIKLHELIKIEEIILKFGRILYLTGEHELLEQLIDAVSKLSSSPIRSTLMVQAGNIKSALDALKTAN